MREVLRPRIDVRGMEKGRGNVRGRKIWTFAARNFQNAKTAACPEEEPEPFRLQWNFTQFRPLNSLISPFFGRSIMLNIDTYLLHHSTIAHTLTGLSILI